MIIVTGTPELVCITTDNAMQYERREKNVKKLFNVQSNRFSSTDERKNRKKKNERNFFVGISVCPISAV